MVAWLVMGCGTTPSPPDTPLALDKHTSSRVLPKSNLERPLPRWVSSTAVLKQRRKTKDYIEYALEMPFRRVFTGHSSRRQPHGLQVRFGPGHRLHYDRGTTPWTWSVDSTTLFFRVPPETAPPTPIFRYEPAYSDEIGRNRTNDGPVSDAFLFRNETVGDTALRGVFVPAPGVITWKIDLPVRGIFSTRAHLLLPEVLWGATSDGATAHATFEIDGSVVGTAGCALEPGGVCDLVLSLEEHPVGSQVTVQLSSDPGKNAFRDYVFFEDPVLARQPEKPKKVVMVFIDTLRADRLGTYGYERATPTLDALGASGVVYEQARSVSPWTLPAARSALTGRQPEEFGEAQSLQTVLSQQAWATSGSVTNAFLSPKFEMDQGWGSYRYDFLGIAEDQVNWGLQELERHSGRNHLLMLHLMDTHLPYREPNAFRGHYTKGPPPGLPKHFALGTMHKYADTPEGKAYVSNRYDQTVRYVDTALKPLFDQLDEHAIILVYSDHGEEFWEHGGMEHGHALWDEVMRVPFILRAPGLEARRERGPVSLLDLAPTLYDLLDIAPPPDLDGESVAKTSSSKPQVFGRTRRGTDSWGLLEGRKKYIATDGVLQVYDVQEDPEERHGTSVDAAETTRIRGSMSESLGRAFHSVLKIRGPGKDKTWQVRNGRLTVQIEGGIEGTWNGTRAPPSTMQVNGDTATIAHRDTFPNEIYLLPTKPLGMLSKVIVTFLSDGVTHQATWPDDGLNTDWLRLGPEGGRLRLHPEVTPLPPSVEVPTMSEGMEDELRILGYVD